MENIINTIASKRNGTWFGITFRTEPKLKKSARDAGLSIVKVVDTTVRKGICYSNIGTVEPIEGERKLPWGEWDETYPNLIINHKGNKYVRLYTSPNTARVKWFVNGVLTDVSEVADLVLKSELTSSEKLCFNVKLNNISEVR